MKLAIISILFVLAIAGCTTIIAIYNKRTNTKVLLNSKKIDELITLNATTNFHNITDKFDISKTYDNKRNFNNVEPAYLMTAQVRSEIEFFSKYIKEVNENRETLNVYENQVQKIQEKEFDINYDDLKISASEFQRRENYLFTKRKLTPIIDCTFKVTMSYSSPQKNVNLSKTENFGFDDLFTCFESISRSQLDKITRKSLTAFERGEVSDSLRYDILTRDNYTCVICGASAKQGARLHVDHIIPVSKGGKTIPENLQTLCERCNIGKSNKTEKVLSSKEKPDIKEENICDLCGSKLVLRKGKYGNFYGCSNFPACKFTKKL